MKDITKLLRKGNLTPRERVLLMIKNQAHIYKTGKELVTEADIVALTMNWKPKDYQESEQYNKYLEAWNTFQDLEMDMQTNYLTTQLALARLEHMGSLFYFKKNDERQRKYYLERIIPDDQTDEYKAFFLQHSGFEYDRLVHLCTFHALPKELQKDVLLLDPIADSDHTYLFAEEQLARVLTGKQAVTDREVNTLTRHIMDSIPWGQEIEFANKKIGVKDVIFNLHFGGYPLLEFGKRLAIRYDLQYENEHELLKKLSQLTDLKYKLDSVVRDAIRDGLFFNEYTPLCNNTNYNTYEGVTKLQHDDLMKHWLKIKDRTTKKIQMYIDDGELVLQECPTKFFEVSINKTYVTGESLMQTKLKLPFVFDYQKQVDDVVLFSYPCYLVYQSYAFENCQYLKMFKEIALKMSEIIGVDVSGKVVNHIKEISGSISTLDFYLRDMSEHIDKVVYDKKDIKYPLQTFLPDPSITLNDMKPKMNKSLDIFVTKASRLPEWRSDT
jgi:hypothetical protein